MGKQFIIGFLCLLGSLCQVIAQVPVFVNEIHYDNVGADVGEGVEIAGPAGTDLACFRIYLYNGATTTAATVYDSIVLSGIIPDQCNGFGTLNFAVSLPAQIQNGSPDGLALVFNPLFSGCSAPGLPTVVQLLSYEGTFVAGSGPAAGMTSTDIGVQEVSGTAVGNSLQLTGAGVLAGDFTWASPATATPGAINNNQTFGGITCGTGPVIPTEIRFHLTPSGCLLPGAPFSIEVCGTNSSGFTAISYTNPVTISLLSGPGVLAGTLTQAPLFGCASFPGLTLSAPGVYQFRATDGVRADTSLFVYVSATCATCPNLDAVLVDACGAQEGRNEILFFNSGDFAIPVSPNAFSVNYGSTPTPTTGYVNSLGSNQGYIDALNLAAGCNIFFDAITHSPIPPNTNFLVMSSTPLTNYNFSAWCSLGAVYVIFSTDPDWDLASGNFKNCVDCSPLIDGETPRYFRTNFSGLGGGVGCDFTYNYTPCQDLLCNGNGDGIDFGYGGGTPTANWTECTPSNVLPVEFALSLRAHRQAQNVALSWQTTVESNSSYFEIERAMDPKGPFLRRGSLPAAGNSSSVLSYAWLDVDAPQQDLWYRLVGVDFNGTETQSELVLVGAPQLTPGLTIHHVGGNYSFGVQGSGTVQINIFDAAGRLQASEFGTSGEIELDLSSLGAGVYFYHITVGAEGFTGKLPIFNQ